MLNRVKTVVSWSTGKDAAWVVHCLRNDPAVEIVGLVTSVVPKFGRVAMHEVRVELAVAQARALGLPFYNIYLDWPCSNEIYEQNTREALHWLKRERGVEAMAFGDLNLADVRRYREALLKPTGINPLFPLWDRNTADLAREMIEHGLDARIVCLDPKKVPREFGGALYSEIISRLPAGVDPCGESGEFHTFCHKGPLYREPIHCVAGSSEERDGFWFTDIDVSKPRIPIEKAPPQVIGMQRAKRCGDCGSEFYCGPKPGEPHCWCQELPPLAGIDPNSDCLCPQCLKRRLVFG